MSSSAESPSARDQVRNYYDNVGWKRTSQEVTLDTAANVDGRLSRWIHLGRPRGFPRRGKYLLDAGCGANPRIHLSGGFRRHLCLDFSSLGLAQSVAKLGQRGLAVLGDLTQLPLADNAVDAINCDHVLYHLVPNDQLAAVAELHRVLAPGGEMWISYSTGDGWVVRKWWRSLLGTVRRVVSRTVAPRPTDRKVDGSTGREGDRELRSADGAVHTGVPVFDPCSLEWWKDNLDRQKLDFTFRSIGALPAGTTRWMPVWIAYPLASSFLLLSALFPRGMVAYSQYYHIIVRKPIRGLEATE